MVTGVSGIPRPEPPALLTSTGLTRTSLKTCLKISSQFPQKFNLKVIFCPKLNSSVLSLHQPVMSDRELQMEPFLKVLSIKNSPYSGPDSLPQSYGIENIALDRVVRLGQMQRGDLGLSTSRTFLVALFK